MKKTFITVVAAALLASGCTAEQTQAIENDLHVGAVAAQNAIVAVEEHEGTIEDAEAKIAALAPKTQAVQNALAKAQAAITALKNHQGTVDQVLDALAVVEKLSAPDATQKSMPKRPRRKKTSSSVAPVSSETK
jgi:hypothetical protein